MVQNSMLKECQGQNDVCAWCGNKEIADFFFCTFFMRELMKSLNGTENSAQNIASVFVKFCSLSLESQRVNLFCVSHLINRYTFFLIDDDHHVFLFSTLNCVSNDNVSFKKNKMKRFHWGLNRPSVIGATTERPINYVLQLHSMNFQL